MQLSATSPHTVVLINFNCFHLLFAIMMFSFISTTTNSYSWPIPPLLNPACIAPWSRSFNHDLLAAPKAMRQQHLTVSCAPHSQNLSPPRRNILSLSLICLTTWSFSPCSFLWKGWLSLWGVHLPPANSWGWSAHTSEISSSALVCL